MDLSRIKKFLTEEVWTIHPDEFSKMKARALRYLQVTLVVIDDVGKQKIGLRGVALAFFSMMAFVPGVALAFAITNGFGLGGKLAELLYSAFDESEDIVQIILGYADNILSITSKGLFGVITFLSFIWLVFWLMIQVENAFNYVWKAEVSRVFWKRISVYIALAFMLPFVLIMFMATMLMFTEGNGIVSVLVNIPFWNEISGVLSWLIIYAVTALIMSLMFKLIPAPKVKYDEALRAAMITALFFCLFQFIYVTAQVAFNRWNNVFGAVAAIPFLMVWLNVSWQILLIGAKLAYAFQFVDEYLEKESLREMDTNEDGWIGLK